MYPSTASKIRQLISEGRNKLNVIHRDSKCVKKSQMCHELVHFYAMMCRELEELEYEADASGVDRSLM